MQARHMVIIYFYIIYRIKKCFEASCSTVMDFLLIKTVMLVKMSFS